MDSSFSPKDEIWFLRVCHHISRNWDGGRLQWMLERDVEMSQARNKDMPSTELNLNNEKDNAGNVLWIVTE
jgi:hypothetical protein